MSLIHINVIGVYFIIALIHPVCLTWIIQKKKIIIIIIIIIIKK